MLTALRTSLISARETTSNEDSLAISALPLELAVLEDIVDGSGVRHGLDLAPLDAQADRRRVAQAQPQDVADEHARLALLHRAGEQHGAGGSVPANLEPALPLGGADAELALDDRRGRLLRLGRIAGRRRRRGARDAQGAGLGGRLHIAVAAEDPDDAEHEKADDGHENDGVAPAVAARRAKHGDAPEGLLDLSGLHAARAILVEHDLGVQGEVFGCLLYTSPS